MKKNLNSVEIIALDETISTNTYLAEYRSSTLSDITVVTAEYQTAGRGQAGNSWESARGANLLFSLLVHPTALPASQLFVLSEAIALSIREAVVVILGEGSVDVKWPNDIYVGDSKLSGILIENNLQRMHVRRAVLGCGVNVNQDRFMTKQPTPVSLRQLLGHDTDRHTLLETILECFQHRYAAIQQGHYDGIHAEYLAALYRRTGFHAFRDAEGMFQAEIAGVEPSGQLLLRDTAGRLRRYAFKEVAFNI